MHYGTPDFILWVRYPGFRLSSPPMVVHNCRQQAATLSPTKAVHWRTRSRTSCVGSDLREDLDEEAESGPGWLWIVIS